MQTTIYPETVQVRFSGRYPSHIHQLRLQGITSYPRFKRRQRWPVIAIAFILGLLAGWLLRGGGAWLP